MTEHTDYISRADAIEAVVSWTVEDRPHEVMPTDLVDRINALPSAEYSKPLQTTLNGDLVSREDALMELNGVCSNWQDDAKVAEIIHALPSAEAYFTDGNKIAEWIPCSERLPEDSGNYLITVADLRLGHIGEHTVTMADFYAKDKKWNSVVDVYAWMPLPKPYREESIE